MRPDVDLYVKIYMRSGKTFATCAMSEATVEDLRNAFAVGRKHTFTTRRGQTVCVRFAEAEAIEIDDVDRECP